MSTTMKQKRTILLLLSTVLLLLSGCIMNTGALIYDNDNMIMRDYNTYDLEKSKQTVVDNCLTGSAELLEGMGGIWELDAKETTDVTITCKIKVSSGKVKLVLIAPDNTLTTLMEYKADSTGNEEASKSFQVEKGKNRIKIVGAKETAAEYKISADKGKMITFNEE